MATTGTSTCAASAIKASEDKALAVGALLHMNIDIEGDYLSRQWWIPVFSPL